VDGSHAAKESTKKWSFQLRYVEVEEMGRERCGFFIRRLKDNVGGTTGAMYLPSSLIWGRGLFFIVFDCRDVMNIDVMNIKERSEW